MKGKCKIEIFDKNGLLKKKVEKDNIITNALDEIINPPFPNYFECNNSIKILPHRTYSPIATNLLGGILLFNSHRTEDVTHIMPDSDFNSYIGSAGSSFTGVTNKVKGSLNVNESGVIENGYKYVWDFGTTVPEFTFNSLSLTSTNGGNVGLDFDLDNDTGTKGEIIGKYNQKLDGTSNNPMAIADNSSFSNLYMSSVSKNGRLVYMSDDFKVAIFGTVANNTYTLTKYNFIDSIRINDDFDANSNDISSYPNWEKELIYTITPTSATLNTDLTQLFWEDNYIVSVASSWNSTTKILIIHFVKIDVDTMTIVEEKSMQFNTLTTFGGFNSYILCDNKLFINDSSNKIVYIINLDTEEIEDTMSYTQRNSSYALYLVKFTNDLIGLYQGSTSSMYIYFFDLINSKMYVNKLSGKSTSNWNSHSFRNVKRLGNSPIFTSVSSKSDSDAINFNIFECFLASILNVEEIHKGADETLKITYTITNS